MARDLVPDVSTDDWPLRPRLLLAVALGAAVLALVLALIGLAAPLRVLVLAVAILSAGGAVTLRPRDLVVLGGASLVAILSAWGMDGSQLLLSVRGVPDGMPGTDAYPDWDTARLVMYLLASVAVAALVLLSLPALLGLAWRGYQFYFGSHRQDDLDAAEARGRFAGWVLMRGVVSLLAVLHFIGICTAVMSIAPNENRQGSWLASQIWTRYQPYLQFMFLNNAYRFYSPEPGPPQLLWFRIQYADGRYEWLHLPTREEHAPDPLGVEFTRRLSLGNQAYQIQPMPSVPEPIRQRRVAAEIPAHPGLPLDAQFRMPQDSARKAIAEYARHVGLTYQQKYPDNPVTGVKVYVIIHNMLEPRQLASNNLSPTDKWTYAPFYMGDYKVDGEIKDPYDPLLYWLIPRFPWVKGQQFRPLSDMPPELMHLETADFQVMDFLEQHGNMKTKETK